MADVRINALSTTATSAASDDYLALDGSANGTRKILATNIAQNVTDVTFGTSGPSAKSSIAARAARQGLVFDGTAGSTINVPAFGTSDFTVDFVANTNDATKPNYVLSGPAACFSCLSLGDGSLYYFKPGASARAVASVFVSGKAVRVTLSKASGVIKTYVNAVLVDTWTDTNDAGGGYTGVITGFGGSTTQFWAGYLSLNLYNRALSAAEVVSLYEAGVPSGADYNNASNTSIITGANSDFSSDTGYWTKGNGATISGGKANLTGGANSNISRANLTTLGKRFRMTLTVGTADGTAYISDGNVTTLVTGGVAGFGSTGTKTFEFTVPTSAVTGIQIVSPAGTLVLDDILLYPVGLLLAPDAAQAGGGLTWYDTSGNAANITLPASGVSWNVPSSLKTAGGWTYASSTETALTLTSGSTVSSNRVLRLLTTGTNVTNSGLSLESSSSDTASRNWAIATNNAAYGDLIILQSNAAGGNALTAGTNAFYLSPSRNLLLGTTTDGGQKLQVSGTGIVKGSFYSARSDNSGAIQLIPTSGVSAGSDIESFNGSSSIYARLNMRTETFQIFTGSSGNTLCATFSGFDNSATFAGSVNSAAGYIARGTISIPSANYASLETSAGAGYLTSYNGAGSAYLPMNYRASVHIFGNGPIRLNNAYTAGAVVTTGYVTIQDSSGTTYKIPVGT